MNTLYLMPQTTEVRIHKFDDNAVPDPIVRGYRGKEEKILRVILRVRSRAVSQGLNIWKKNTNVQGNSFSDFVYLVKKKICPEVDENGNFPALGSRTKHLQDPQYRSRERKYKRRLEISSLILSNWMINCPDPNNSGIHTFLSHVASSKFVVSLIPFFEIHFAKQGEVFWVF